MATRDASVTDVGYEDDETEQLKLRDRKAEGKYGGGRRDKSWQLVAILWTIPGLVAHTGWCRNGSDERVERYREGQVENMEAGRQVRIMAYLKFSVNLVLSDWKLGGGRFR